MEYRDVAKLAGVPILAGVLLGSTALMSGAEAGHGLSGQLNPTLPGMGDGPIDGSQDAADAEDQEVRLLVRPTVDPGIERRDRVRALRSNDDDNDDDDEGHGDLGHRLSLVSRGSRLEADATTDVWAHGKFAYTGTFNAPCGGTSESAGVHIWRVREGRKSKLVEVILTPEGSRSNDVKVDRMNSGTILVHSNEPCNNGPGGIEVYNVDDPRNPVHLSSIRIDEINPVVDALFGGVTDVGVHNQWLFTQGDRDYVAVVSEGVFDNFRVYDITDPRAPVLASAWGAEEVFDPGVGEELVDSNRVLAAALWLLDGPGGSTNRFLHDITGNGDGTLMYLSNWDAGLVLLDVTNLADPQVVSVALDLENGSLDSELNSHAAWPNEDGTIVVETEEDFDAWEAFAPPGNLTFGNNATNTIPGTAISTNDGDIFEGSQTGSTVTVDAASVVATAGPLAGEEVSAAELAGNQPTFGSTGPVTGEGVWIGRACNGDPILNAGALDAGDVAIVRRGACTFAEKLANSAAAGAAAIVISNNDRTSTPWGGVRIWDYSDPANPILASTFDTVCSASSAPSAECEKLGTYSVHNVIVETEGRNDDDDDDDEGQGRVKAYLSYYWEGVLILDVTDPYNPVEIARFSRTDAAFEAQNGGHQDFWGIYKIPGRDEIYASDRNGGLYVFEEGDDDDDEFRIAGVGDDDDDDDDD